MKKWTAAAFLVALLVSILLSETALHPPRASYPLPPDTPELTWRAAILGRPDGVSLAAWEALPTSHNGRCLILLHGVADHKANQIGLARWFATQGFRVLIPDSRGHGESGGFASYGVHEAFDVKAWADSLPCPVSGYGASMGAAILLQAAGRGARFHRVVAEAPFTSFRRVAAYRVAQRAGLPSLWWAATPLVASGFVYSRVRYGIDLDQAAPEQFSASWPMPVLLIHGAEDRNIPVLHSQRLASAGRAQLWVVPGGGHVDTFARYPDQFRLRVLRFLTAD